MKSLLKKHTDTRVKDLSLIFLGGAAVAVIAGILFAPLKGSESRKIIKDKAGDINKKLMNKIRSVRQRLGAADEPELEPAIDHYVPNGRKGGKHKKDKAHGMVSHLKSTRGSDSPEPA